MSYAYGGIKVSDAEVAQVAYNAGFRGQALTEIVARQFVEASDIADNVNDQSGAKGLWQILPSAHQEFASILNSNQWADPQTNANMAFQIYTKAGNSMSPWAADGTVWQNYIGRAQTAVSQVNPNDPNANMNASTTATPAVSATSVFDPVGSILHPVIEFLIEAGMVAGGLLCIFYGAYLLWKEAV